MVAHSGENLETLPFVKSALGFYCHDSAPKKKNTPAIFLDISCMSLLHQSGLVGFVIMCFCDDVRGQQPLFVNRELSTLTSRLLVEDQLRFSSCTFAQDDSSHGFRQFTFQSEIQMFSQNSFLMQKRLLTAECNQLECCLMRVKVYILMIEYCARVP